MLNDLRSDVSCRPSWPCRCPLSRAQLNEPTTQVLPVLLHPILHDLGAVANFTEMAVHPFNHGSVRVSQLFRNRVNADRPSLIERLQPRARVRMAKRLRPNLAHLRAPALRALHEVELTGVCRDAIDEGA